MSVNTEAVRIAKEAGNDVKVAFDFAFKIFSTSDLTCYKVSAAGVYTLGVLNGSGSTGYTVSFDSDDETGTVTWNTAPVSSGFSVIIGNAIEMTQETSIAREGALPARTLRNIVDKLTLIVQQLSEQVRRAPKQPITPVNPDTVDMDPPEDGALLRYVENDDGTFTIEPIEFDETDLTGITESSGLRSARPATPLTTTLYYATDEEQLYLYSTAKNDWTLLG